MVSITYNGLTLTPPNGYLVNIGRGFNGIDNMRISEANITGRNGGNVFARKDPMRTIVLRGTVYGQTVEEFFTRKQALIDAFWSDSDSTLTATLWNGDTLSIPAKCVEEPIIDYEVGVNTRATYQVTLRCPYPYWQGETTTLTLELGEVLGFDFPFDFPFDITVLSSNNVGSLDNTGLANVSFPKITINGASGLVNPTITNATTGTFVQIATNVGAGDIVVIEQLQSGLSVKLNGNTNYFEFFIGELSPLVAGNNTFIFTADGFVADASIDIEFKPARRSF